MSQKDLANSFFAHLDTASTQSSRAMSSKWSEAMSSNSTMNKNSQDWKAPQNQGMWQQGSQQFSNHQKTVFCLLSQDQKSGASIWKTGKQG